MTMRTEWMGHGEGATILEVFTFVLTHGTGEQALTASRAVLRDREWFQRHRLDRTKLDLCAEPSMLVTADDVRRAIACLDDAEQQLGPRP